MLVVEYGSCKGSTLSPYFLSSPSVLLYKTLVTTSNMDVYARVRAIMIHVTFTIFFFFLLLQFSKVLQSSEEKFCRHRINEYNDINSTSYLGFYLPVQSHSKPADKKHVFSQMSIFSTNTYTLEGK